MELFDIPGFDNYQITKDGKVYSRKSQHFMTPYLEESGYYRVKLRQNGVYKHMLIHRLLAITFIPNPENKTTVDHINHIPTDNRLENLRWATSLEQNHNRTTDSFIHNEHSVECRDKQNHDILIASFPNCCAAAIAMFNDRSKNSLINRCAQGKKSSAYGYWWCFT